MPGCEELAPFDVIHVGAAAPIIPAKLVEQLSRPGRMFIPVGTHSQEVLQVDKSEDGTVTERSLFGVRVSRPSVSIALVIETYLQRQYVPLTDREDQVD
jgi:protein-L-isoaspartate O-methyltransferase